jgi:hypothetical protein
MFGVTKRRLGDTAKKAAKGRTPPQARMLSLGLCFALETL